MTNTKFRFFFSYRLTAEYLPMLEKFNIRIRFLANVNVLERLKRCLLMQSYLLLVDNLKLVLLQTPCEHRCAVSRLPSSSYERKIEHNVFINKQSKLVILIHNKTYDR